MTGKRKCSCHSFTIRGYAKILRKKDPTKCCPLEVNNGDDQLQFPPLEVPNFKWWRCEDCVHDLHNETEVQEIKNAAETCAVENAADMAICKKGRRSKGTGSSRKKKTSTRSERVKHTKRPQTTKSRIVRTREKSILDRLRNRKLKERIQRSRLFSTKGKGIVINEENRSHRRQMNSKITRENGKSSEMACNIDKGKGILIPGSDTSSSESSLWGVSSMKDVFFNDTSIDGSPSQSTRVSYKHQRSNEHQPEENHAGNEPIQGDKPDSVSNVVVIGSSQQQTPECVEEQLTTNQEIVTELQQQKDDELKRHQMEKNKPDELFLDLNVPAADETNCEQHEISTMRMSTLTLGKGTSTSERHEAITYPHHILESSQQELNTNQPDTEENDGSGLKTNTISAARGNGTSERPEVITYPRIFESSQQQSNTHQPATEENVGSDVMNRFDLGRADAISAPRVNNIVILELNTGNSTDQSARRGPIFNSVLHNNMLISGVMNETNDDDRGASSEDTISNEYRRRLYPQTQGSGRLIRRNTSTPNDSHNTHGYRSSTWLSDAMNLQRNQARSNTNIGSRAPNIISNGSTNMNTQQTGMFQAINVLQQHNYTGAPNIIISNGSTNTNTQQIGMFEANNVLQQNNHSFASQQNSYNMGILGSSSLLGLNPPFNRNNRFIDQSNNNGPAATHHMFTDMNWTGPSFSMDFDNRPLYRRQQHQFISSTEFIGNGIFNATGERSRFQQHMTSYPGNDPWMLRQEQQISRIQYESSSQQRGGPMPNMFTQNNSFFLYTSQRSGQGNWDNNNNQ